MTGGDRRATPEFRIPCTPSASVEVRVRRATRDDSVFGAPFLVLTVNDTGQLEGDNEAAFVMLTREGTTHLRDALDELARDDPAEDPP